MGRVRLAGLIGLGLALAAGGIAHAQGTPTPDQRPAYDRAFQEMLRDPGSLEKSFAFAELAVQAGDFEGAIGALERMLLINPNLPRVRLELGVLYFRLGSNEIARTYLQSALETPDVPEQVRERVAAFLEEIERRQSRHAFTGSLYGGLRYQTNANTAPGQAGVLVGGQQAILDDNATSKSDWNAFLVATLRHTYDFQRQGGEVLESTALLYDARQFEQTRVNVSFIELTSGPRAKLALDWIDDLSVRPFGILNYVAIDDARHYWAPGAGLEFRKPFGPSTDAEVGLELRDKRYRNSAKRPNNDDESGVEVTLRGQVGHRLAEGLNLLGGIAFTDEHAERESEANREIALTGGVSYSYAPVASWLPWTSSFSVTRAWTRYDEADPTIVDNRREDRDWRLSFLTAVPITAEWAAIATIGRTVRTSSIQNFEYDNDFVSLGAAWRF